MCFPPGLALARSGVFVACREERSKGKSRRLERQTADHLHASKPDVSNLVSIELIQEIKPSRISNLPVKG